MGPVHGACVPALGDTCRDRCSWGCCRCIPRGTPSSCTTRCRASPSRSGSGPPWPRPGTAARRSVWTRPWSSWTGMRRLVSGTYVMPSFGRYERVPSSSAGCAHRSRSCWKRRPPRRRRSTVRRRGRRRRSRTAHTTGSVVGYPDDVMHGRSRAATRRADPRPARGGRLPSLATASHPRPRRRSRTDRARPHSSMSRGLINRHPRWASRRASAHSRRPAASTSWC